MIADPLFVKTVLSAVAFVGAAPYLRNAMSHPSFYKRSYRAAAVVAIMTVLALIIWAIWTV